MKRRGFTLAELLVVISVIALLIAIVSPGLSGSVDSARRAKCMAGLRGLGQAILMYCDAHHGVLPFANRRYSLPAGWTAPIDALSEHLDAPIPSLDAQGRVVTSAPFLCPADRDIGPRDGLSYAYMAAGFMQSLPPQVAARLVTVMYEQAPALPVFWDLTPVHADRKSSQSLDRSGRNMLRFDGVVTRAPRDGVVTGR